MKRKAPTASTVASISQPDDFIVLDDSEHEESIASAAGGSLAAAAPPAVSTASAGTTAGSAGWAAIFAKPELVAGVPPPASVMAGVRCVTWASAVDVSRATAECTLATAASATSGAGIRLAPSALTAAPALLGGRALVLDLDCGKSWCALIRGAVPAELCGRLVAALGGRPDAGWPAMLYRMGSGAIVEAKRGSFVVQDAGEAAAGAGAATEPWAEHPCIDELRAHAITRLGLGAPAAYNAALVHRYRPRRPPEESSPGASDELGYHSDANYGNEIIDAPLGQVVVSFSFGARRSFDIKKRDHSSVSHPAKGKAEPGFLRLELNDGDCVVMLGAMQAEWVHRVPALTKAEAGSATANRYNITLRRCIAGKLVGGVAVLAST